MTKVKPTTKEQFIDYMVKYISLGTYDRRFLDSLVTMNLVNNKPVTSNQAELLNTITKRYHRQLAKQELDSKEMIELKWTLAPIESLPQFTQAFVSIEDDNIVLRSPYKKEFVSSLRSLDLMDWNKDSRTWTTPANESRLRDIINLTENNYPNVNYCPTVSNIIDELAEYETIKYWNPTLTRINGNLYIVACNASLMRALSDITIDLSFACLAKLTHMGIEVSPDLIAEIYDSMDDGDKAIKEITFALDHTPLIDEFNYSLIVERLKMIQADMVVLVGWYVTNKSHVMDLGNMLKAHGIPHVMIKRTEDMTIDPRNYKMPVKLELGISSVPSTHMAKNIRLVNSNPVSINERM
jgi:cell fate (sporulation/competence/biofilm development) regulator YmcA (YheA/YmcA/DUF963 family)